MKIQRIKRKDLDVEKYSRALENAMNYRIYAEYWYLDVLTNEKWECLVYGDYEVIMPIPLQFKLGIKFVLQPTYCQQLGVFYQEEISNELFSEFEKKLHSYRVRAYHFNEENTSHFSPIGTQKTNQILDLNRPYTKITSAFRKNRKHDLKTFEKSDCQIFNEAKSIKEIIDFKKSTSLTRFSETNLSKILEKTKSKENLTIRTAEIDGELIAYGTFLTTQNRIIYINSGANQLGKKLGAPTVILASIFKEYADEKKLFDFEGSSIPSVSEFFSGLRGKVSYFTQYSNFR